MDTAFSTRLLDALFEAGAAEDASGNAVYEAILRSEFTSSQEMAACILRDGNGRYKFSFEDGGKSEFSFNAHSLGGLRAVAENVSLDSCYIPSVMRALNQMKGGDLTIAVWDTEIENANLRPVPRPLSA